MIEQPSINNENRIRWGVVALITCVAILGILGPKLLWMSDAYAHQVRSWSYDAQYLIHPLMRMVLVLITWAVLIRRRGRSGERSPECKMGLLISPIRAIKGVGIGLGCTFPMLLLGLMSDSFTPNRYEIMYLAVAPGLTEEIFYRALLFGMLVQLARFPFWWAAVITGLVFGLAHVDITPDEGETIVGQLNLWLLMISLGGFMYAWLYAESGWNLWLVISLHTGMNLWWDMFDLTSTPLGGWGATLSRIASVGLVVLLVIGLRVLGPAPGATIRDDRKAKRI